MTDTEKSVFVDRLVELALALGADLPTDRIRVYVKLLSTYQLAHLEKACSYFEHKGCQRYFPTVPEFHASVARIARDERDFCCICCKAPYVFDQALGTVQQGCKCKFEGDFWCVNHGSCRQCCGCNIPTPTKEGNP